jgi:hypothetical protein
MAAPAKRLRLVSSAILIALLLRPPRCALADNNRLVAPIFPINSARFASKSRGADWLPEPCRQRLYYTAYRGLLRLLPKWTSIGQTRADSMTEPRLPNDRNASSSEDRFGRQDDRKYSGWSSAIATAAIVIILGIAFYYFEVR